MTLKRLVSLLLALAALASTASAEWKEKVLYSFQGLPDGSLPVGAVVFDKAGNLYGATTEGGSSSCISVAQCGTVYQLAPPAQQGDPWTETVLYVFKGNASKDGASPAGGLVIDSAGNLYGTTAYGGTGNCVLLGTLMGCGTVFKMLPPKQKGGKWTERVLYSFPTAKQGYLPNGDLVFDSAGNLYGATDFGGGFGTTCDGFYQYCGAVFELSPPTTKGGKWTEKVLHGFKGVAAGKQSGDGANPNGMLVLDSKGAIYGTTQFGGFTANNCGGSNGFAGCGMVFELRPPSKRGGPWDEQLVYQFKGRPHDGGGPNGGLVFDAAGSLYGTTVGGGNQEGGVAFKLALSAESGGVWKETLLHIFGNGNNAIFPGAGLIFNKSGELYGAAPGGIYFRGAFYRLKPPKAGGSAWSFANLYDFTGAPDGYQPESRLTFHGTGNLYGTTQLGGTGQQCQNGCGTVFRVVP
jgi:hypothetical protein